MKKNKRKQWTNEQMIEVMEAVETGKSGINRASVDHGVPKTILQNRLSVRVKHGKKLGPECYLNEEEEKELASFVKFCASIGYGKTRREMLGIAQSVATYKGVLQRKKISQGWLGRFFERQHDLSLRKGDNTSHVRMDAVNEVTMKW